MNRNINENQRKTSEDIKIPMAELFFEKNINSDFEVNEYVVYDKK